jgi:nitrogenase-stabilizing/protective protein
MTVLNQLRGLSAAEDFFAALDVPFDPAVVRVARLHILRRMGEYLREADLDEMDDGAAREVCRAQLQRAYDDFLRSSPIEQRVFKVLKDAVKPATPAPKPFVPLSALTGAQD